MIDFSDKMLCVTIGVQLGRIRKARTKTLEEVAFAMDLPVFVVEQIEDGEYENLNEDVINSYISACGMESFDIVKEAQLVTKVHGLAVLFEEFLNQDMTKHELALALSDVICRTIRMAYNYETELTNGVELESEMIMQVCSGLRKSLDNCEYAPELVPEYTYEPVVDEKDEIMDDMIVEEDVEEDMDIIQQILYGIDGLKSVKDGTEDIKIEDEGIPKLLDDYVYADEFDHLNKGDDKSGS